MNLPQKLDSHQLKNWHAACCVVIVEQSLFFILRSETMPTHPGQVAFLGGGKQAGETPLETALREFEEESSFEFTGDFLGYLDPVSTFGSKRLIPVCFKSSLSQRDFLKRLKSNGEWSHGFFIPLGKLADESLWSRGRIHRSIKPGEVMQKVYFFPIHTFIDSPETILWGASATIVVDFLSKTQSL